MYILIPVSLERSSLFKSISSESSFTAMPIFPPPEHALGLAELERGDYREAVRWLEEASRINPGRTSIQQDLERARAEQ